MFLNNVCDANNGLVTTRLPLSSARARRILSGRGRQQMQRIGSQSKANTHVL